ncbi:MAG: hypothetical protein ACOYD0_11220 [Candidatus Nanopelagicales bacterium]
MPAKTKASKSTARKSTARKSTSGRTAAHEAAAGTRRAPTARPRTTAKATGRSRSGRAASTIRSARPGVSGAALDTVERWLHLSIGLSTVAGRFADASYDKVSVASAHATPRGEMAGSAALLPGAILGVALAIQRQSFDAVAAAEGRIQAAVSAVGRAPIIGPINRGLNAYLKRWDEQYQRDREQFAELAMQYLATTGPQTLDELLARIDLESVIDRVDLDDVIDRVDLEAVVNKVPLEQVIGRIDMGSVVVDTVGQVQVANLLREGTGVMAATTAELIREQRRNAAKLAGRPFRRMNP